MQEKRTVLRTVRMTPSLDEEIRSIAEQENRTMANTINRILTLAVKKYKTRQLQQED